MYVCICRYIDIYNLYIYIHTYVLPRYGNLVKVRKINAVLEAGGAQKCTCGRAAARGPLVRRWHFSCSHSLPKRQWEDPKSRTLKSGFQYIYSYGVDHKFWIPISTPTVWIKEPYKCLDPQRGPEAPLRSNDRKKVKGATVPSPWAASDGCAKSQ